MYKPHVSNLAFYIYSGFSDSEVKVRKTPEHWIGGAHTLFLSLFSNSQTGLQEESERCVGLSFPILFFSVVGSKQKQKKVWGSPKIAIGGKNFPSQFRGL